MHAGRGALKGAVTSDHIAAVVLKTKFRQPIRSAECYKEGPSRGSKKEAEVQRRRIRQATNPKSLLYSVERELACLKEQGHKIDSKCYATAIAAFADHGSFDLAYHLFNKMVASGVLPTVEVYTALLQAARHAGFSTVIAVWNAMLDAQIEPGERAYATVLGSAFLSRDTKAFTRLFDAYRASPLVKRCERYCMVIALKRTVDEALGVVQLLREDGVGLRPPVLQAVLQVARRTGDVDGARRAIAELKIKLGAKQWCVLMCVHRQARDIRGVLTTFQKMESECGPPESEVAYVIAMRSIADHVARDGPHTELVAVARKLYEAGWRRRFRSPRMISSLMRVYAAAPGEYKEEAVKLMKNTESETDVVQNLFAIATKQLPKAPPTMVIAAPPLVVDSAVDTLTSGGPRRGKPPP